MQLLKSSSDKFGETALTERIVSKHKEKYGYRNYTGGSY